jgi:ABC-type branched-subunit amino acid transport system ATPase component
MLRVESLTKQFGGLVALSGVDLTLEGGGLWGSSAPMALGRPPLSTR